MKSMSKRVISILTLLLQESRPIPVKELAGRMDISRRTIFRELCTIDAVLKPFNMEIGSKPGEGIKLEGTDTDRQALKRRIDNADNASLSDYFDRKDRLLIELLRNPKQKLIVYADHLEVSNATVSHDLNTLDMWLRDFDLSLNRGAHEGFSVEGEEINIRRLLINLLHKYSEPVFLDTNYLPPKFLEQWKKSKDYLLSKLHWLSPQSKDALLFYLLAMIIRVANGYTLKNHKKNDGDTMEIAAEIAETLKKTFAVELNEEEAKALSVEIAACRINNGSFNRESISDENALKLSYEMIDRFDPELSYQLKNDNLLVNGLAAHVSSAILRIQHRVELPDPMVDQVKQFYPEIFKKCQKAAKGYLKYNSWVPDDEISYLAGYFGSAVLRLAEQKSKHRMVKIGVVCIYGIGSSYLLASQIRKNFAGRVQTEVSWQGDEEKWAEYDLLVSTTPFPEVAIPIVVVSPIITTKEIAELSERIDSCAEVYPLSSKIRDAGKDCFEISKVLSTDALSLLNNFSVINISEKTSFNDTLLKVAKLCNVGNSAEDKICTALREREELSPQAIPELEIVLLHCRTAAVKEPLFFVLRPVKGKFKDSHFADCLSCVAMLMPQTTIRERGELIGAISSALSENEDFLKAIKEGNAKYITNYLEHIFKEYIYQFCLLTMKG